MSREESKRVVLERWPEGDGEVMQFRLLFHGNLPPITRGHAPERHAIRQQLHPQLRTLWETHPALKGFFNAPRLGHMKVEDLANNFSRNGFRFVPLVKRDVAVACSLDIIILRRHEYHVFDGYGDLDNRVKSLLDGLKMPTQGQDLGGAVPGPGEDPFFCLLEDDSLVYDFTVTTDRLLLPLEEGKVHRDAFAIINVTVKSATGPFSVFDFGG